MMTLFLRPQPVLLTQSSSNLPHAACCSKKGAAELHLPNWKILKAATLTTAPFTAVYSGFAWMSFMDPDLAWEESRRVGFYFLGTFRRGNIKDCGGNTARYGWLFCTELYAFLHFLHIICTSLMI